MVLGHSLLVEERTKDVLISRDVTFESMLLSSKTLLGLNKSGFFKPSPIQLTGIPLGICGFDLILEAKSGTGKTAVFTIISLEKLDLTKGLQSIILAPTREIANQIHDVIKTIGCLYEGLCVEIVIGGLPVKEDVSKLQKNVHILVGSPGRLRHLLEDKHINTSSVRLLVLDEVDKLMEKSFLADINYIFSNLPSEKQIIMSSATYADETKNMLQKYVKNAQHVCPDSTSILLGIEQKIAVVEFNPNIISQTSIRFKVLLKILSEKNFKQCLVFCNYQARVVEVYKKLLKEKWPVEHLYGQQDQTNRLGALKTLQEYKCRILISTDLAARGIDASNVDLVINFEPPFEWQTYLHRIGRAGRYGSFGTAITILSVGKEKDSFLKMLSLFKNSLDMYELWTNNKVNIVDNEENISNVVNNNIPPTDECSIQETKRIEFILDLFDDDSDRKVETIDDFDNLCDSLVNMKCANKDASLEKTHFAPNEKSNIPFQHIGLDFYHSSNNAKDPKTHNGISTCFVNIIDEDSSTRLNNSLSEFNKINSKDNKKDAIECLSSFEHMNNEINIMHEKPETCLDLEHNSHTDDNDEVTNTLLALGLPTSFSSKSKSYQKTRKKHFSKDKEPISLNETIHDNSTLQTSSHTSSSSSSEINSEPVSNSFTDIKEIGNKLHEYILWYNKLKFQTKQIEMSVYVNEMSQHY